ncbi:MAG: ATPase [Rhodospirillales bacterium]|nr:ATPase [Rhodospirillales bacterium]
MADLKSAKRFYKKVEFGRLDDGYTVLLDGREIKTPAKFDLKLRAQALAEAIVLEWDAQGETIQPETMPMFRMAATVLDRAGPRRGDMIEVTMKFAETDLLCYRAAAPPDLNRTQAEQWQPWLDWVKTNKGAKFEITTGIQPITQPVRTLSAIKRTIEGLDDYALMGVSQAAAATGSLVLALAIEDGALGPDEADKLSHIEEMFRMERWGADTEAEQSRRHTTREIEDAARFIELSGKT